MGGELATPELAAVQQAIRTTLNDHFDTLADPLTKLQAINPYRVDTPRTASVTPHDFLVKAAHRSIQVLDLGKPDAQFADMRTRYKALLSDSPPVHGA